MNKFTYFLFQIDNTITVQKYFNYYTIRVIYLPIGLLICYVFALDATRSRVQARQRVSIGRSGA